MAKYFGNIGFSVTRETLPGVWGEDIEPKQYYGDVLKISRRWQTGESINDNIVVSNKISILADPFAFEHFQFIRWVEWQNQKWIVSDVEVEYPRLILSLGGIYNE